MRLGTKKKRIWRRSGLADSRVFLNWTQSNIIRLQELRFDLHRFLNLFVNAWRHLWHRNSRMWHCRNREKSRHRSCEVCLTLLNLNLGLKSSGNSKRALSRAFNHPRPLIWSPWNTGFILYQAWGEGWVGGPKEVLGEDVAEGQTPRHQDVGWKVMRWSAIVQDRLGGAWTSNVGIACKVISDSFLWTMVIHCLPVFRVWVANRLAFSFQAAAAWSAWTLITLETKRKLHGVKTSGIVTSHMEKNGPIGDWHMSSNDRVVKSSRLLAKIIAYLVSISWLLCSAFLYGWHFLFKISLNWPLSLTTQPSTSKLSVNPE